MHIAPDQSPDDIAADIDRFSLITLEFPAFTDGRSYSLARTLRERYGYRGELRAVGNVLKRVEELPWWRVVNASGRLIPHGAAEQSQRLQRRIDAALSGT